MKFSLEHRKHNYDKYFFVVQFLIVAQLCSLLASKLGKLKIDCYLYFKIDELGITIQFTIIPFEMTFNFKLGLCLAKRNNHCLRIHLGPLNGIMDNVLSQITLSDLGRFNKFG